MTIRFKTKTMQRFEEYVPNFYDPFIKKTDNTITLFATAKQKKYAIGLIHKVYLAKLKSSRKYTASTKTKAEVRGGGRKPWKQKGTGQARAGSIRSPLWVGGGTIFGPKPRVVKKKINRKELRRAFFAALYLKRDQLLFLERLDEIFDLTKKTKDIISFLTTNNLSTNSRIVIIRAEGLNLPHGTYNLKNVSIMCANCLNLPELLKADKIILSRKSLEIINSTYKFNFSI